MLLIPQCQITTPMLRQRGCASLIPLRANIFLRPHRFPSEAVSIHSLLFLRVLLAALHQAPSQCRPLALFPQLRLLLRNHMNMMKVDDAKRGPCSNHSLISCLQPERGVLPVLHVRRLHWTLYSQTNKSISTPECQDSEIILLWLSRRV